MAENNSDKKANLNEEERLKLAKEKFERNYEEFKSKKINEIPCFRSTFLTSTFYILLNFENFRLFKG